MRVYLLPEEGHFYKANLHSHSTVSDGKWTPEEMKRHYMDAGYSIVAYTDHHVFVPHNDLTDEHFLALNGYEMDVPEDRPWDEYAKTCHFCLIALDRDRVEQRLYHDSVFIDQNADRVVLDRSHAPITRRYDPAFISALMEEARADGFFVTYNHPVWSLEDSRNFLGYHGMHALEIINYGGVAAGYDDKVGYVYDILLRDGRELYCVGADDNQNVFPIDHPRCDSFGGFTMIMAEKLDYPSVIKALEDGNFYSSMGPVIHSLSIEDGKVHIECDGAKQITLHVGGRRTPHIFGTRENPIYEAEIDIPKVYRYVRVDVVDFEGRHANTRAYFPDEII
jgi:hypothetical protein